MLSEIGRAADIETGVEVLVGIEVRVAIGERVAVAGGGKVIVAVGRGVEACVRVEVATGTTTKLSGGTKLRAACMAENTKTTHGTKIILINQPNVRRFTGSALVLTAHEHTLASTACQVFSLC